MKLLAFDTALNACAVAYVDTVAERAVTRSQTMPRGHAEALMPMIGEVMQDAGVGFEMLDRLAVTVGPGSFTGVRVGLAAARGLALAAEKPLIGVGTLQAHALTVLAGETVPVGPFMVVLDARRDEVYCQTFSVDAIALSEPQVMSAQSAAQGVKAEFTAMFGSGAGLVRDCLPQAMARSITAHPLPSGPDPVALARFAAHQPEPSDPPHPLYLRAADAKPQKNVIARKGDAAQEAVRCR